MSAISVYQRIKGVIRATMDKRMDESSLTRLALYVSGVISQKHGSPAQAAKGLCRLHLREAQEESLERQIRRMENDPEVTAEYSFHPMARQRLLWGHPGELRLIVDPSLQEDRVVMISVNVWYRGRSLPLVWTIYPANQPLKGEGFWQRVKRLLELVATILPQRVLVTVVADRAFGTPAFTDLVEAQGWNWLVRVQGQTVYQAQAGAQGGVREGALRSLVHFRGQRKKLRGQVFKKAGWRSGSVVVYWGHRHPNPLCLVSNLPPGYYLVALYRQRFAIEPTFRDYKRYGWQWEQGQVSDLCHLERLLVGMAIATWLCLLVGTWRADECLAHPPTGRSHTRPFVGKHSLFSLGLQTLLDWLGDPYPPPDIPWLPSDWDAPNWSRQITAFHVHAFLFASVP